LDSAGITDWDSLSAITFSFPPKSTPWSDLDKRLNLRLHFLNDNIRTTVVSDVNIRNEHDFLMASDISGKISD